MKKYTSLLLILLNLLSIGNAFCFVANVHTPLTDSAPIAIAPLPEPTPALPTPIAIAPLPEPTPALPAPIAIAPLPEPTPALPTPIAIAPLPEPTPALPAPIAIAPLPAPIPLPTPAPSEPILMPELEVPNACNQTADFDQSSLIITLKQTSPNLARTFATAAVISNDLDIELPEGHDSQPLIPVESTGTRDFMGALSPEDIEAQKIITEFNRLIGETSLSRTITVKFPQVSSCEEMNELIDIYADNPRVESIALNLKLQPSALTDGNPNDPFFQQNTMWGLERVNANKAWRYATGRGVKVGVIDRSIADAHPDIALAINMTERNGRPGVDDDYNGCVDDITFCNAYSKNNQLIINGSGETDPSKIFLNDIHGTHVAGIIAAKGNNNQGTVGIAPEASLIFASAPDLYMEDLVYSVSYLIRRGASVLNLSLGFFLNASDRNAWIQHPMYQVLDAAIRSGVIVVVSAGNEGLNVGSINQSSGSFDAFSVIPGIISVGATNSSNQRANFSNFGANVDIAAPGVGIMSTAVQYDYSSPSLTATHNYAELPGTSMAAPMVAGAAALLKSYDTKLTSAHIIYALKETGADLPGQNIGKLLNIEAALNYVKTQLSDVLDFQITSPAINQTVTVRRPRIQWTAAGTSMNLKYRVHITNSSGATVLYTLITSGLYPALTYHDLTTDLPDGTYTLSVTGLSALGNQKTVTRSFTVSVPPTMTEIVNSLVVDQNTLQFNKSKSLKEKFLYDCVRRKFYYILPSGQLYRAANAQDGAARLIGTLSSDYYTNIRRFPRLATLTLNQVLSAHKLNLSITNNSVSFNSRGEAEKWFTGLKAFNSIATDVIRYKLTTAGDVVASDTNTVIMKLDSSFYTNINQLVSNPLTTEALMISAHAYRPTSIGNVLFNFTGSRYEKRFTGNFGAASASSYMTPDGSVYFQSNSVPVMKLSTTYFIYPDAFDSITLSNDQFFRAMNKLDIQLTSYKADYDYNWSGRYREKWFAGKKKTSEASTPKYYILSDGRVYRFKGDKANMVTNDVLIARIAPAYYVTPSTMIHTAM